MITDPEWRLRAACRGADPDLFRPEQPRVDAAATIRRFCATCPVAGPCRRDAVEHHDRGVWGGLYFTGQPHPRGVALDHLNGGLIPTNGAAIAPRGACPTCGRVVTLRGDGRVRRHGGGCGGEGYLPRGRAS